MPRQVMENIYRIAEVASPESRVYIDDADRDWIVGATRFPLEAEGPLRYYPVWTDRGPVGPEYEEMRDSPWNPS